MGPRTITGEASSSRKAHRHELQAVFLNGHDLLLVVLIRPLIRAEHVRDAGAIQIAVAEADTQAALAQATARFEATVLLPTPPLPEAMAMTFFTPGMLDLPSFSEACGVRAPGGSLMSKFSFTSPTPGSFLQHVHRLLVNEARDVRIARGDGDFDGDIRCLRSECPSRGQRTGCRG
jgi:hypothetical protein